MTYAIKELYYTIQGEGYHTGRAAVFCRFSGCNLWSGLEKDRHKAICQFCDTDFWGTDGINGGKYDALDLIYKCKELWPINEGPVFVVCTGGEPLLQLDDHLIEAFHKEACYIAIETNGTVDVPSGIDWVCVSPKEGAELKVHSGNELKLVYPQGGFDPEQFVHLNFEHFYLQPMDNDHQSTNTKICTQYCLDHPRWKLSLQTHKYLGIP